MNIEKIYARISMNGEIPEFEKKLISENFTFKKYRKNTILVNDNEDCDKLFFVVKGVVRIFYFNIFGKEVTRTIILENEFCTNLVSFSKQDSNNENIQCLEDCILFYITRQNFYKMLEKSHIMTTLYSKVLENFIRRNLKHFHFMNTLNERERIEKFLIDFPEINHRVKDKIIATYLGLIPEFFSKIKSKINREKKSAHS